MRTRPAASLLAALTLFSVTLISAACGNDTETAQQTPLGSADHEPGEPTDTTSSSEEPTDTTSSSEEPTTTDAPHRIVSLSPTATEMLFAVGAGTQVVAVDEYSNYPPEAPMTDLSGWDPNIEAVLSYDPDLVVISTDSNNIVAGLAEVDVDVLVNDAPTDIDTGYEAILELGRAVGREAEAEQLATNLRTEINDALNAAPDMSMRVYHELDENYFSASSFSFIGAVYAALGADNIADAADADGYGYPQLTEEYIVEADPELIVITDQVSYSAADVAARPGWESVSAVRNGNITVVEADIASRWGPRLPQFITAVVEALAAASATLS